MLRKLLMGGTFLLASSALDSRQPVDRYAVATLVTWTESTCFPRPFITQADIDEVLRHDAMESVCGHGGGRFHGACVRLVERLEPACDGSSWCRRVFDGP